MSNNIKLIDLGVPDGQKTRRYRVVGPSGFSLGQIRFYGAWRKYCFFPEAETLFDSGCLDEIADLCRAKSAEWRAS